MTLSLVSPPGSTRPDLIRDGQEGFIVPIRSAADIAARLDTLRRDPDRREAMAAAARRRAGEFQWSTYEATLALCAAQVLAKN